MHTVHELCTNASLEHLGTQWRGRKSIGLPYWYHFVGSTVELLQGFALHPQLHLGILLEDLRIALAEQLRYPLVGYASCAQPCGIRGAQVVNPKVGNLCPSQSFRPSGLELLEMSGWIQIARKQIRSFTRNRHLILESLDGEQGIAELKWIRKPTKIFERIKRDEDVLKGFDQLRKIRQFLGQNPNHLISIGKLRKPLSEYDKVQYAVVARDHWIWVAPSPDGAIFTHDAFTASISRSAALKHVVEDLLTYDWLPMEGRDYTVRYDKSYSNGVQIETETFYAL